MTNLFEKASRLVADTLANCGVQGNADYIVWYKKQPTFAENDVPNSAHELHENYVRLAKVRAVNLDQIFEVMQGENWSPKGEAKEIISGLGLSHTSMSVGDIIQGLFQSKYWVVLTIGYGELKLQ